MGLWDIIYDIVKEYRNAKGNDIRRLELAKSMVKKAYLRFSFEWTTEINSGRLEGKFSGLKSILEQYSQLFLDIAVEIFETLPKESQELQSIAGDMKRGAYGMVAMDTDDVTPIGNQCAELALKYAKEL